MVYHIYSTLLRVSQRSSFAMQRRIWSRSFSNDQARKFLTEIGIAPSLLDAMIDTFKESIGRPPSIIDLNKFGVPGLKALAVSVERDLKERKMLSQKENIHVIFIPPKSDSKFTIIAKETETVKDIAGRLREVGSLLECACGGIAACSTCHVIIVDKEYFQKLPPPEEAETDMLDLAFGVTDTSRLGCQLKFTKACDGIVLKIPDGVHNLF
jgi:ferredoxin